MLQAFLYMLAINCGIVIAIQATMNSKITQFIGMYGMVVSFGVGLLTILIITSFIRPPLPTSETLKSIPMYAWLGGILGAVFVLSMTYAGPQIGFTTVFVLAIAGQLITSMIIEHFGFFGTNIVPFTLKKLVACGLIFIGAFLSK